MKAAEQRAHRPARRGQGTVERRGHALSETAPRVNTLPGADDRIRLAKGEVLVQEGQYGEEDFRVASGYLMLFKALPDRRRQVVAFRFPGELVIPRRHDRPWPVTVQALTPATVTRIAARGKGADPRLLDEASDQIALALDLAVILGTKNTEERVASFLLRLSRAGVAAGSDGNLLMLPMSRTVIADYLGLASETVSRAFTRLADCGLIALPRPSRVELLDRSTLEALSKGAPVDLSGSRGRGKA